VTAIELDYGRPAPRSRWKRIVFKVPLLLLTTIVAIYLAQGVFLEIELRGEARRLLSVNAPSQRYTLPRIAATPEGLITLPDGRRGRLVELADNPTRVPPPGTLGALITEAVQFLGAEQLGCTVVGTDPSGTPTVQLWALDRVAYRGMCGNSTREEMRRGNMRVWRNVGAFMVDNFGVEPSAAGRTARISVLNR
jgi:hypothetical protein